MQRREKVYFPRKTRAPYFTATGSDHRHRIDAAALLGAAPLADAAATAVAAGNTTSSTNAASSSAWNEADAAAGGSTTVASALASPASAALRAIASVPRMPSRVSSSDMNTSSNAVASSSRAAILPTVRRTSDVRLSISRQDMTNNIDGNMSSSHPQRAEQNNASGDAAATTTSTSAATHIAIDSKNPVPDWRLRVRMRTVGVGLVLALNIGTDPPDTVKPHPCAVLQCWMDPRTVSRSKAKEWIGERLEQQYAVWQLARTARPLRYRRALDPTVEDVRNLCTQLRRQARNE
eukprot:scaffold2215_cov162-Amphora_coffeaeformis.AAC.5